MDFTVKTIKGLNVFIYKSGIIEINSKKYIGYSTKEAVNKHLQTNKN